MCDERTERDLDAYLKRKALTRRGFQVTAAASLAISTTAMSAPGAAAGELAERTVSVPTPDGAIDGMFIHPKEGAHAAVLFWPDVHGVRPAHFEMARRLASSGYAVLAVNPYYRTHQGQLFFDGMRFGDPGARELVMPHYGALSADTVVVDAAALVAWLDEQASVDKTRGMGAVGFCMTGSWTLRAAAAVPGRVKAPCSFHGGGLVTDAPDSPHKLASKMTGGALIAIAENDHQSEPGAKDALIDAFKEAGVPAEIEVYADAMHGWVPTDSRAYNAAQAERGWSRMLALFEAQLGAA
ncbi:MAG: dienelactone hydrolase family protein [Pseudomonadota bacterium]